MNKTAPPRPCKQKKLKCAWTSTVVKVSRCDLISQTTTEHVNTVYTYGTYYITINKTNGYMYATYMYHNMHRTQ